MALINCADCGNKVSDQAALCPGCGRPTIAARAFPSPDKERFDLGVAMLKGYYDAIETRLAGSLALYVVVIGWLIASNDARRFLASEPWLFGFGVLLLTFVLRMYGWNVAHWLRRWRDIRTTVEALHYMETDFYTRWYQLPRGTWWAYFTPIALLYLFIVLCLILIAAGRFAQDELAL